jgi:Uma2 family endonuclease
VEILRPGGVGAPIGAGFLPGPGVADDDGKMARVGAVGPRVSYSDLERAPEDGRRYEIYDGEVFVVPAPLPLHQLVTLNLEDHLRSWARLHCGLVLVSPIDIVLTEYDVLQPDIVVFGPARRSLVKLDQVIRHVPDLAIEVLSPSTAATDRGRKMQLLARHGLPEYWLVDPVARTVEAYRLQDEAFVLDGRAPPDTRVESRVLRDFTCDCAEIFRIEPEER